MAARKSNKFKIHAGKCNVYEAGLCSLTEVETSACQSLFLSHVCHSDNSLVFTPMGLLCATESEEELRSCLGRKIGTL